MDKIEKLNDRFTENQKGIQFKMINIRLNCRSTRVYLKYD